MGRRGAAASSSSSRAQALDGFVVDTITSRTLKGALYYIFDISHPNLRGKLGAKTARGYAVGHRQITTSHRGTEGAC